MNSYDVLLNSDGDLPERTQHVNDYRITIQRLETRLSTHIRTVIFDKSAGLPFIKWSQERPQPFAEMDQTVRRTITTCPGVKSLTRFERSVSGESVSWTGLIESDEGQTFALRFEPFPRTRQLPAGNWHPTILITLFAAGTVR